MRICKVYGNFVEIVHKRNYLVEELVMNRTESSVYDLKKVHRVNLIIVYIVALTLAVMALTSLGWSEGSKVMLESIVVCIVLTGVFFLPLPDFLKAFIYSLVPVLVSALQIFTKAPFPLGNHYLIFLSIAMISLYFNRHLILAFGIFINALLILFSVFALQTLFMNQYRNLGSILALIVYIDSILAILFFLSKWGRDLIRTAAAKEKKATDILVELKKADALIEDSTAHLNL